MIVCARRPDGSLLRVRPIAGMHRAPNGARCLCHGHCMDCERPVVMDRLGRFVHVTEYRAHR